MNKQTRLQSSKLALWSWCAEAYVDFSAAERAYSQLKERHSGKVIEAGKVSAHRASL